MSSRSFRLETRSRARDEIKRMMQTVEKVRKWEKIWIETGLSNHLKVFKWVPVRDDGKEEVREESVEEERPQNNMGDASILPEIQPAKELVTTLEAPQGQLPPDLLLASETKPPPDPSSSATSDGVGVAPGSVASTEEQRVDWEKRRKRVTNSGAVVGAMEDSTRPRSPH